MSQLQTILDKLAPFVDTDDGCVNVEIMNVMAIIHQMMQAEPVAYVDGDDASRRILWEPNKAAFDLPVGTKLYAAPQAVPAVCEWKQDADFEMGDTYHSSCGELWSFIDGWPKENRVSYCHHCGKPVKLASAPKGTV